jgi:hypothetical protein
MSRTELQSSLLQGISAGRGVVVDVGGAAASLYCAEHRRRRHRGTRSGRWRTEEERRMRLWSAGLRFRVLSGEATARIAMGDISPASAFAASGDWGRRELYFGGVAA